MSDPYEKKVTFIQAAAPSMKAGKYRLSVSQHVQAKGDNAGGGKFTTDEHIFAVKGERFQIQGSEIYGVFPPDKANGEFSGVLPQVVFNKLTLPWERSIVSPDDDVTHDIAAHTPWLAVLSFNEGEQPRVQSKGRAQDLVPKGQTITVEGSTVTGTGGMPAHIVSYPGLTDLDYGESPDEACSYIDVPLELFATIAPSIDGQYFQGHIRKVDTIDSEDEKTEDTKSYAVILGNRVAKPGTPCHAYVVSLEKMSEYLPDASGNASAAFPAGTTHVRLICYRVWRYTADVLNESFDKLLESVSQIAGKTCSSGLRIPSDAPPPAAVDVHNALAQQSSDDPLSDANAEVLVQNALNQGYVPFNHELRHGGKTVSWYRGPLAPYAAKTDFEIPISGPDAANRYNPDTGLFDVSYGAAWQLGQLLAIQNRRFAQQIYEWKKDLRDHDVVVDEANFLNSQMHAVPALKSFMTKAQADPTPPPMPEYAIHWLAGLRLLKGVPFNYLVPNQTMLPPESIRFFHLDLSWVDALVDGALSIGRSTSAENLPPQHQKALREAAQKAHAAMAEQRPQARPNTEHINTDQVVMGFVLRSKVCSGWPRLNVNAYPNGQTLTEIPKLRMERIGEDVLIALFDGNAGMVAIHEAPEALHCGFEVATSADKCAAHIELATTLRQLQGSTPGRQYLTDPVPGHSPNACVPYRGSDAQTVGIPQAVLNIKNKLHNDFGQDTTPFTSAEFGLEVIKGVSKVEFYNPPPSSNPVWKCECPQEVQP